jgi:RNA polymerase sigma-B factor
MSRMGRPDGPRGSHRESVACDAAAPKREDDLFGRCHRGDAAAREQLVQRFLPMAERLARRYQHSGEPLDDLEQVALIGLIKAIDTYDPEHGTSFGGYALPVILGEIRHHFRDHTWVLHVPSQMRELTLRVSKAARDLSEQLRREPSVLEIAHAIGATDEQVLNALQASGARRALSFGDSRGGVRDDDDVTTIGDGITIQEDGFTRAEDRAVVESLLRTLTARERVVLRLRFEHDMTQSQIAGVIGTSQVHVSRILREALEQMRAAIAEDVRRLPSAASVETAIALHAPSPRAATA